MNCYINFERYSGARIAGTAFDLLIIGAGVAGLITARELSGQGLRLLIVESDNLEETAEHETGDAVEVQDDNRVFGGFAMARAGQFAQFDPIDFAQREWVPNSGWPLNMDPLTYYCTGAARRLDRGPLLSGNRIGMSAESSTMREYARSKREGEDILSKYTQHMHVDVYRIALVQRPSYLEQAIGWGAPNEL
ncbi:FAD-dependent oxidoreductase [Paraburkholderia fynbosensis]|uniref:FAD dependent oxidoreductase domain-containing protein n=1 Tax=Paraburkholderia fynbosensis TaxID=1200993 RepID=A0A6J5H1L6_9BURK|nr:FAD-dependent oxidoreductase [Paraburkholderia fynbosensis]CAB3810821.1 hypothetical protein LMG27177_07498 [Paraburkholderia fynbosensis]